MKKIIDLTKYKNNDRELSLLVFNTEELYIKIFEKNFIEDYLEYNYIYTNLQLRNLKQDIKENLIEKKKFIKEIKNITK